MPTKPYAEQEILFRNVLLILNSLGCPLAENGVRFENFIGAQCAPASALDLGHLWRGLSTLDFQTPSKR